MPHELFFWLIAAHFICDYVLQSDTMAREKNRYSDTPLQKAVPWPYWMFAHAITHGAAVAYILSSVWLGIAEFVGHYVIDVLKCERKLTIKQDQALHIALKFMWLGIYFWV